jgi:hypothetical protein
MRALNRASFNFANGDPTPPGKPLPDNFLRPYAGYGSIRPYEMTGTSNYNAWNHTQFSCLNTNAVFNPAGQQVNPDFRRP